MWIHYSWLYCFTFIYFLRLNDAFVNKKQFRNINKNVLCHSFVNDVLKIKSLNLHHDSLKQKSLQLRKEKKAPPFSNITARKYFQYLVNCEYIYTIIESKLSQYDSDSSSSSSSRSRRLLMFQDTRMERSEALKKDLIFLRETFDFLPEDNLVDPKVLEYGNYLMLLVEDDTKFPQFLCHYYNLYFAHTAGGMMIGNIAQRKFQFNQRLQFYMYENNKMNEYKTKLRHKIDHFISSHWNEAQKNACANETLCAFTNINFMMECL